MKTLLISICFIAFGMIDSHQEIEKMTATFNSYEDAVFYFMDKDGFSNEFHHISEEAKKAFDLTKEEFKGKKFLITYKSETEVDELNEAVSVSTIISLKEVQ